MRLPRNVSGKQLALALSRLGYAKARQEGSHITCTTFVGGEHHVYIPDHSPVKVGTLQAILKDVAQHFAIDVAELLKRLRL